MAPSKNSQLGDPCNRCKPRSPSVLLSRGEPFCQPCFHKFLSTKVRKMSEGYKVGYTKEKVWIMSREHVVVPVFGWDYNSNGDKSDTNTSAEAPQSEELDEKKRVIQDCYPFILRDTYMSLGLVDLLADIIQEQKMKHRGRQGFYIHFVEFTLDGRNDSNKKSIEHSPFYQLFKERFTQNEILSYNIFDLVNDTLELYPIPFTSKQSTSEEPASPTPKSFDTVTIDTQLSQTLSHLSSRASRADALLLSLRNVIPKISATIKSKLESYPFNQISEKDGSKKDSKLAGPWKMSHFIADPVESIAQQVLSNISKGRMNLVYADMLKQETQESGEASDATNASQEEDEGQELKMVWPLKEIKALEIEQHLQLNWPTSISALSNSYSSANTNTNAQQNMSKKQMSIDFLIKSYFTDIDASFPSVATTVVRTVEKLADPGIVLDTEGVGASLRAQLPASHSVKDQEGNAQQKFSECDVCGCKRNPNTLSWINKITVNEGAPVDSEEKEEQVQASTTTETSTEQDNEKKFYKKVCYGCVVMLKGSLIEQELKTEKQDSLDLPHWNSTYIGTRGNTTKNVLSEFEL